MFIISAVNILQRIFLFPASFGFNICIDLMKSPEKVFVSKRLLNKLSPAFKVTDTVFNCLSRQVAGGEGSYWCATLGSRQSFEVLL